MMSSNAANEGSGEGSVTLWLGGLKAGDPAALQPLWERYFGRLVNLARGRLRSAKRPGSDADEEDAALSAFDSFHAGVAQGRFPKLDDREDLWRILVVLTSRKASAQVDRWRAQKRGAGRIVSDADVPVELAVSEEPSPEFAAMLAEEFARRMDALDDPELRRIALMKLEGYSNLEIRDRLGCSLRTVARRLDLIRRIWEAGDSA